MYLGESSGRLEFPNPGQPTCSETDVEDRGAVDVDKSHHSATDAIRHDMECGGREDW
jgi:hypothetical protein